MNKCLIVWALCALVALGCNALAPKVVGSGRPATQNRSVPGFTAINVSGSIDARVVVGPAATCVIKGDDNILPLVHTEVKSDTLSVYVHEPYQIVAPLEVIATTPRLDRTLMAGTGRLTIEGALSGTFALSMSGTGDAAIANAALSALDLSIAGSGDVVMKGTAERLVLTIAGSGNAKLDGLCTEKSEVSIAGAGDAALSVEKELSVSVLGAGNVAFDGNPVIKQSMLGSGSVTPTGRPACRQKK